MGRVSGGPRSAIVWPFFFLYALPSGERGRAGRNKGSVKFEKGREA